MITPNPAILIRMMSSVKNNRLLQLSLILALALVIWSFYSDTILSNQGHVTVHYGLQAVVTKILLFLASITSLYYLIGKYKHWRYAVIYWAVMLALFAITYPGVWRWDDIINLEVVSRGEWYYWQNWISSLYFQLCLSIIPIPSGIVFLQITFISLVVGHIIGKISEKYGNLAVILYLPFLMPAVLDSNLYPIRATPCAYLELLLVFELIWCKLRQETLSNKKTLALSCICIIVTAWRPENILYCIGLLAFLFIFEKYSIKSIAKYAVVILVPILVCSTVQTNGLEEESNMGWDTSIYSGKAMYDLTGFIEPLSKLVTIASDRNECTDELARINENISIEMLKTHGGMGTFWGGGISKMSRGDLSEIKSIYYRMALKYPVEFFNERIQCMIDTNVHGDRYETLLKASAHIYDENFDPTSDAKPTYETFASKYYWNTPINEDLRLNTISMLEAKKTSDYYNATTGNYPIFYNCIYSVAVLCFLWAAMILSKQWAISTVILMLAAKFTIIIASEPMRLYMYFFSTQLICTFLLILLVIYFAKNRKKISKGCETS